MPNQVPPNIKDQRSTKLIELTDKSRVDFLNKQIGTVQKVLFEASTEAYITGYTENYTPIVIWTDKPLYGEIHSVKILSVSHDKCIAELI